MHKVRRYILYFIYLIARLILFPLYFVSGLVRRKDDTWVFGSWGGYRFADNSAAFFLYCQTHFARDVRLVWISRDNDIVTQLREMGYEAHKVWSIAGMLACFRAKLYIFDSFSKDINFWTSRGATKINLWSGVPLKAFERDIQNRDSRYYRLFHGSLPERCFLSIMMPWHVVRPDVIIATSRETAAITERAFDLPTEAVFVTGFPRNDVLFVSGTEAEKARQDWPALFRGAVDSGRHIFMYLPTYRDSGRPFFDVDWSRLDGLMEKLGATFFFKFHPDDTNNFRGSGSNVVELPLGTDIYSMMAYTDTLISDYSSIIFDYMLLDRPVIYYTPDLKEFTSSSRSLIFDPAEIAVGSVCANEDELLQALEDVANNVEVPAELQNQWSSMRKRFNAYVDGESSRRTAEVISNQLRLGQSGSSRIHVGDNPATET
jgi:CDP-glycerol glycerophosphotransferase (TagB/SpsB family)